jgi:RNA polymerase sigma-70 factor (ECF subfamily)
MIYNLCLRYTGNEEDAKDAAQEVFIKLYRNLSKYNFKCKFSTWAYKIAINSCIDGIRKKNTRPQTENIEGSFIFEDNAESPVDALILKESLKNIEAVINRMPDEYKKFIVLRDINGFSYQDIAEITNLNLGTVKSKISRARQCLKTQLTGSKEEVE